METLKVGQRFPELTAPAVGGGSLRLPDDLVGGKAVIIFYRGRW